MLFSKNSINTKLTAFIFIVLIAFSACKKSSDTPIDPATNVAVQSNLTDVAYGTDAKQTMDIYLPANRTDADTKVIVMVHGGAWVDGDKADFNTYISMIQAGISGFVVVNINYRLAVPPSTNLWPTQQTDVNAALDFVASKASYYHYNASKIVLFGASAGAHLALLNAYHYNTNNRIKTVIDFFGPTDMVDLYSIQVGIQQQAFALFMGGTPTTNATAYANASPLSFVSATVPPTIIFHGTADAIVPLSESTRLKTALTTAGVINQYTEYPGEPHGQFSTANTIDALTKASAFVSANVK